MKVRQTQSDVYVFEGGRVELAADGAEDKWQLLFPLGATKHRHDFPKEGITFSAAMLRSMVSNWEAEGKPERQVNYFHRGATSARDTTPLKEKLASGWIRALQLAGKPGELGPQAGLYAQVSWTKRARGYIEADELRYLSPEFTLSRVSSRTGKEQGPTLLGAALLNDPFLTELPRVAASDSPQEPDMPTAFDPAKLRKRLGLAETATDDDVVLALDKAPEVDAQPVQLAELTSTVTTLSERLKAVEGENATLKASARKAEIEAFVSGLVKAGKVSPSIRANVVKLGETGGLEAIKFFEQAAPVVSLTEVGITGSTDDTSTQDKKAAGAKVQARLSELQAKGVTAMAAMAQVKAELPNEVTLYFSA